MLWPGAQLALCMVFFKSRDGIRLWPVRLFTGFGDLLHCQESFRFQCGGSISARDTTNVKIIGTFAESEWPARRDR